MLFRQKRQRWRVIASILVPLLSSSAYLLAGMLSLTDNGKSLVGAKEGVVVLVIGTLTTLIAVSIEAYANPSYKTATAFENLLKQNTENILKKITDEFEEELAGDVRATFFLLVRNGRKDRIFYQFATFPARNTVVHYNINEGIPGQVLSQEKVVCYNLDQIRNGSNQTGERDLLFSPRQWRTLRYVNCSAGFPVDTQDDNYTNDNYPFVGVLTVDTSKKLEDEILEKLHKKILTDIDILAAQIQPLIERVR